MDQVYNMRDHDCIRRRPGIGSKCGPGSSPVEKTSSILFFASSDSGSRIGVEDLEVYRGRNDIYTFPSEGATMGVNMPRTCEGLGC
jgi:hypothetical protein